MAIAPDLNIYRVRLSSDTHTAKIEYKYYLDPDWIFVASGVPVDSQGYISPSITISGLETNKQYYVRATDEFCGITSIEPFTYYASEEPEPPLQGQWLISASVCEQVDQFSLVTQITGLSSPSNSFLYDEETEMVFFVDYDDVTGCFAYYDPLTVASKSDITYVQPVFSGSVPPAQRYYYATGIDKELRRLYMVGKDTDGLQIYHIATGIKTVVPFGYNVNIPPNPVSGNGFNRTQLLVFNTTIIATDIYSATLNIIDRTNETLTASIPFSSIIDSDKCLIGSPNIIQVGNEYWVLHSLGNSAQAPNQSPNIYRYNLTFSNTPTTINISAWSATWTNGAYTRSTKYIPEKNVLYILDSGANSLIKVDTLTFAASRTFLFNNRNGKSNISLGFVTDPITNELFLSGGFANTISDNSPSLISYRYDIDNDLRTYSYPGTTFSNLIRIGDSDVLHGGYSGNVAWTGGSWATDGGINIFNKQGAGDNNTGIKIGTQLGYYYEPIPPGTPSGQFKSNTPSDPDYQPPSQDLTTCPVTYSTACPTVIAQTSAGSPNGLIRYEFSLPVSVTTNPAVRKVRVSAMQGSIEVEYDEFFLPNANPQLFEDSINVPSGTYTISISYYDQSNNLTAMCSNLKTVTVP